MPTNDLVPIVTTLHYGSCALSNITTS